MKKKARDLKAGDRFLLDGNSILICHVMPTPERGTVSVAGTDNYYHLLGADFEVELAPQTVTFQIEARELKKGDTILGYGQVTSLEIEANHVVSLRCDGFDHSIGWTFPLTITRTS